MIELCPERLNALVAGGRCAGEAVGRRCRRVSTAVSMPLLRAVDVRGRTPRPLRPSWPPRSLNALVAGGRCAGYMRDDGKLSRLACLNALVAGGRCAGSDARCLRDRRSLLSQCPCCGRSMCGRVHPAGRPHPPLSQCPCCGRSMCGLVTSTLGVGVSMPLLRAVDVRAHSPTAVNCDRHCRLSQCPCCGRSMCGLPRTRSCRRRWQTAVSMPLLRAVDVRDGGGGVREPLSGLSVSMPLLRAVDVRDAKDEVSTLQGELSQCPCCGRSMCGHLCQSQCPCCGRSMWRRCPCLNALVAGGRCAGRSCVTRVDGQTRWHELSQCPCCGRSMCGLQQGRRRRLLRGSPVSMPLLRAVDVRATAINAAADLVETQLSQCPCCGRSMCGTRQRRGIVSMPLLRAVDGGRGRPGGRIPVSMPLLRAVDVRDVSVPVLTRPVGFPESQCPCCGRSMCGATATMATPRSTPTSLNALVAGGRCARAGLKVPLLRAVDVRAVAPRWPSTVSMPLLRAVDVRGCSDEAGSSRVSRECPCCGRSMGAGRERGGADRPVSMPLLRAVDVRAWSPCNALRSIS